MKSLTLTGGPKLAHRRSVHEQDRLRLSSPDTSVVEVLEDDVQVAVGGGERRRELVGVTGPGRGAAEVDRAQRRRGARSGDEVQVEPWSSDQANPMGSAVKLVLFSARRHRSVTEAARLGGVDGHVGPVERPIAQVPSSCLTMLAGKFQEAPPLAERNSTSARPRSGRRWPGARLKASRTGRPHRRSRRPPTGRRRHPSSGGPGEAGAVKLSGASSVAQWGRRPGSSRRRMPRRPAGSRSGRQATPRASLGLTATENSFWPWPRPRNAASLWLVHSWLTRTSVPSTSLQPLVPDTNGPST